MTKKIALLLCILLINQTLLASTKVNGMTAEQKNKAKETLLKKVRGTLATTFQTNLYEFSDEANKTFSNFTFAAINFASEYGFIAGVSASLVKDLRNERKLLARDPNISISIPVIGPNIETDLQALTNANSQNDIKKQKADYLKNKKLTARQKAILSKKEAAKKQKEAKLKKVKKVKAKKKKRSGGTFTLSLRNSLVLPLSDRSKEETNLRTVYTFQPVAVYILDPALIKGLILIANPSVRAFSHKFKVDINGNSNTQYSANMSFLISYQFAGSFNLTLSQRYSRAWTYDGRSNDQFSFDQSVAYIFAGAYSVYVGHAIGGSALEVNGQDSNLKAFDSRQSQVYAGISYRF